MGAETVAEAVLFALRQPEGTCLEEMVLQPSGGRTEKDQRRES